MKKLLLAVVALGTLAIQGGCASSGGATAASNEPKVDDKSYITGSRIGRSERPSPEPVAQPAPAAPAPAGN